MYNALCGDVLRKYFIGLISAGVWSLCVFKLSVSMPRQCWLLSLCSPHTQHTHTRCSVLCSPHCSWQINFYICWFVVKNVPGEQTRNGRRKAERREWDVGANGNLFRTNRWRKDTLVATYNNYLWLSHRFHRWAPLHISVIENAKEAAK